MFANFNKIREEQKHKLTNWSHKWTLDFIKNSQNLQDWPTRQRSGAKIKVSLTSNPLSMICQMVSGPSMHKTCPYRNQNMFTFCISCRSKERRRTRPRHHGVGSVLQVLTWSWISNKLGVLFGLSFDDG